MVLTSMSKPAFAERDAQLIPAEALPPASPAERQREYLMVQAEMIFAGDR